MIEIEIPGQVQITNMKMQRMIHIGQFNKAIKKSEEKGGSKRRPENIRQKIVENLVTVILLPAIAPFANVRIFMVSSCSKVYSLNS